MTDEPTLQLSEVIKTVIQHLGKKGGTGDVIEPVARKLSAWHGAGALSQSEVDDWISYLIDGMLDAGVIFFQEDDDDDEGKDCLLTMTPLGWRIFKGQEHPYAEILEPNPAIIKFGGQHQEHTEEHDPERVKALLKKILGDKCESFGLFLVEYDRYSPSFLVDDAILVFRQGDSPEDDLFITSHKSNFCTKLSDVHIVRDMESLVRAMSLNKQGLDGLDTAQ